MIPSLAEQVESAARYNQFLADEAARERNAQAERSAMRMNNLNHRIRSPVRPLILKALAKKGICKFSDFLKAAPNHTMETVKGQIQRLRTDGTIARTGKKGMYEYSITKEKS